MKGSKRYYGILLAAVISMISFGCVSGDSKSGVKTKAVTSEDQTALNGAMIKNDIDVEATGVKVREVYLMDAGRNMLEENVSRVGDKIYMVIKLDTGWTKENGKSYIGASERISTNAGRVIVDAEDIFKDYEASGIDAVDAGVISLSAVITQNEPGVENFVVKFRVWDKKGKGEVKGQYKFRLRN
jgi:hypothetical protein